MVGMVKRNECQDTEWPRIPKERGCEYFEERNGLGRDG